MQPVIQAGPRGANLGAFLGALERLEAAIAFLQAHRSMQSAEDALRHTAALRDSGLAACAAELSALLQKHAAVPEALLARLRTAAEAGGSGAAGADASTPAPLDLLPEAALARMRPLADAMLGGGSGGGRSCVRIYVDARRGVLRSALGGLLGPLSSIAASANSSKDEAARLSWQHVESRIPGWASLLWEGCVGQFNMLAISTCCIGQAATSQLDSHTS